MDNRKLPIPHWAHRLVAGTVLLGVSGAVAQGSMFSTGIAIARLMGRAAFADWSLIYATWMAAVSFAVLGTSFAATRLSAEFQTSPPDFLLRLLSPVHRVNLILGALISISLLLLGDTIASRVFGRPELAAPLQDGAAFVFLTIATSFWVGVATGLEKFRILIITNITAAGTLVAFLVLLFGRRDILVPLAGITAASLVTLLLNRCAIGQATGLRIRQFRKLNSDSWRKSMSMMAPTSAGGIATAATFWFIQVLLERSSGGGAEIANFTAAYNVRMIAMFGLQLLFTTGGVIISSTHSDHAQRAGRVQTWIHLSTGISALLIVIIIFVFARNLVSLYGDGFGPSSWTLRILALSLLPEALGQSLYNVLAAEDRLILNMSVAVLPREIVRVATAILLVPNMGACGAAWAYVAATTLFVAITGSEMLWRKLTIRIQSVS